MGRGLISLVLGCTIIINLSASEWIATHSGLPPYSKIRPDKFLLNLTWQGEADSSEPRSISLSLKRSEAVDSRIPIYKNDVNGKPYQSSLSSLKHSDFYHDVKSQASISVTSFKGESFLIKGSFLLDNEKFDVEPFHPKIHKRSISAVKGDHIVQKSGVKDHMTNIDFLMPKKGSRDWNRLQEMEQVMKSKAAKREKAAKSFDKRSKRQTLPDTTYIVQIYMVVDFYLYEKLSAAAIDISWPESGEDYVSFMMGHAANEIDVRYRNIDSSTADNSFTWTVGTKLSYLNIVTSESDSSWTDTDSSSTQLDSTVGLTAFNDWIDANSGTLPSSADHYMLVTSHDLTSGGDSSNAGLAYVSGACGDSPSSINEFGSSTVLAHELGHNLGSSHDGSANSCNGDDSYVMSSVSGTTDANTVGNNWLFSICSIEYFDAYFTTLNGVGENCMTNDGSYIASWADDYTEHIGQTHTVDDQCRLLHGDGYYYATSKFSEICQSLWCTADGSSLSAKKAALPHTTCGDGKWCVEELCISDPSAPALDEDCPFGDGKGIIFSNSDITCATATAIDCAQQSTVVDKCCATCPTFAKPWLGPACPYGDKNSACSPTFSDANCALNADLCCGSCCSKNGAADGYSCEQPTTTTTLTITTSKSPTESPTTSSTTKSESTTKITTTSKLPTTAEPTTKPTSALTSATTSAKVSTIASGTMSATTSAKVSTTASGTMSATTSAKASTTASGTMSATTSATKSTTTADVATTASKKKRGVRIKLYIIIIRITSFASNSFGCNDPDLQDTTSPTYNSFYGIVCVSISSHVKRVTRCGVFRISCGSIIANSTIEIEERDGDDPADAAPANSAQFLEQLAGITNDPELVVAELPTVLDVDECADNNLNDCSPNADCTNTDGYYTCTCNKDYPLDLSEYADEPGRVCAKPCTAETCSSDQETCLEVAESEPVCECSGDCKKGLQTWHYILIGAAVGVVVLGIVLGVIISCCCCKKSDKVRPVP